MKLAMLGGFFLLALTFSGFAEARPVTVDGEAGFFLTRDDMEAAVEAMEELEILKRDYDAVKGFYAEQLKVNTALVVENNKVFEQNRELKLLGWILGGCAIGGTLIGFFLGTLVP